MVHPHQADGPDLFRLRALPSELWDVARLGREFRADDQTIRRWVREGRIPLPTLRRRGRPFWSPADVETELQRRLRRIGAKLREAVGVPHPNGLS
jgi:hypothetical protein